MSIVIKNISKNFKEIKALKNIDLKFEENQITGLIGFNGSGKTTTFNILTNIIEAYEGNVCIEQNGALRKITQNDRWKMSYLSSGTDPQNFEKVVKHFNFVGGIYGLSKKQVLKRIEEIVNILDFKSNLNIRAKNLSKGNQQKIKIISTFINPDAKYIFLDEPFDGLDPIMVKKLSDYFYEQRKDKTIVITSHRMDIVDQICDSFFILKEGKIVERKKATEKSNLFLVTNIDAPIEKIEKMKEVLSISKNQKEIYVEVVSQEHYKILANKLITEDKCKFVSLKEKGLTESVFERYADE